MRITNFCLVAGSARDTEALNAFDFALLDAGVGDYNHVKVSSILPPHTLKKTACTAPLGQPVYTAYGSRTSKKRGFVSASVAIGIPKAKDNIGMIMEFSGDCSKAEAESRVRNMVINSMAKRGIELEDIASIAIEAESTAEEYTSVFAGVVMW